MLAGELTWKVLEVEGEIPSPRCGHSLASIAGNLVLFGGASHEEGPNAETFIFNPKTTTWRSLPPSDHAPAARYEHSCIAHENEMLVLFGASEDGPLDDVWSLNCGMSLF